MCARHRGIPYDWAIYSKWYSDGDTSADVSSRVSTVWSVDVSAPLVQLGPGGRVQLEGARIAAKAHDPTVLDFDCTVLGLPKDDCATSLVFLVLSGGKDLRCENYDVGK